MTLGQAIKELRLKKGLTQEELATNTDIQVRTIQRIENDIVNARSYTIQRIAKALDVNFEKLNNSQNNSEENNPEKILQHYSLKNNQGTIFLYVGIILIGIALGVLFGIYLAKYFKLNTESNEMIALSLTIWLGISFIFCYYLSIKLKKN